MAWVCYNPSPRLHQIVAPCGWRQRFGFELPRFPASPSSVQKGARGIRRSLKQSVNETAADFSLTADIDQNDICTQQRRLGTPQRNGMPVPTRFRSMLLQTLKHMLEE